MQGLMTVNRKSNIVKSEMTRKTEEHPLRLDEGRGRKAHC
jgi:hypothetical protein